MTRIKDLDNIAPDDFPSKPASPLKPPKSSSRPLKSFSYPHPRREVYRLIGRGRNPLSSFLARPRSFAFDNQYEGEEIILILRRHPITNLSWVIAILIMFFAPLTLKFFPLFESFPPRYQFVFTLFWYLITLAFFLESFLSWYFNVYIVTDERILDFDFHSLIYKEISDAEIEAIQDVTIRQGGLLATFFNYGTIFIQTAAEKPQFEFESVPHPDKIAKVLQQLRLEEKQEAIEGRVR